MSAGSVDCCIQGTCIAAAYEGASEAALDFEMQDWYLGAFENHPRSVISPQPRSGSPLPSDSLLAADQQASTKAILFTKSARLYTTLRMASSTCPRRYP